MHFAFCIGLMLKAGQANELSKLFRRDRNKISRMTSDSEDDVDFGDKHRDFDEACETKFTGASHGIIAKLFLRH